MSEEDNYLDDELLQQEREFVVETDILGIDAGFEMERMTSLKRCSQEKIVDLFDKLADALSHWLELINSESDNHRNLLTKQEKMLLQGNYRLLVEMRIHLMEGSAIISEVMHNREDIVDRRNELIRAIKKQDGIIQNLEELLAKKKEVVEGLHKKIDEN